MYFMVKDYSDKEVGRLLEGKRKKGEEDLLILQKDGTRACAGWELTEGYHLTDLKKEKKLSDEELLESAYKEAEEHYKK